MHVTDSFVQCRSMVAYSVLAHLSIWAWINQIWHANSSLLWSPSQMNDWVTNCIQNCDILSNALWGTRMHKYVLYSRMMKNKELFQNFIFNTIHYTFAESCYIDNMNGEEMFLSYDKFIHFGRPVMARKLTLKQPLLLRSLINEIGFGRNSVAHCLSMEGLIQFGNNFNNSQWIASNFAAVMFLYMNRTAELCNHTIYHNSNTVGSRKFE